MTVLDPVRTTSPSPAAVPSRVRRATNLVTTVVLAAALVLAGLLLIPAALGYQRYVIVSGSMEPQIHTGSIVYSKAVPVDSLRVGDVIDFVPPAEYGVALPVTHRIVAISRDGGVPTFRTQGDANADPDPWVMTLDGPEQARVVHAVPWVGYVLIGLGVPSTRLLAIGVPAALLVVLVLIGLWRTSGDAVVEERRSREARS